MCYSYLHDAMWYRIQFLTYLHISTCIRDHQLPYDLLCMTLRDNSPKRHIKSERKTKKTHSYDLAGLHEFTDFLLCAKYRHLNLFYSHHIIIPVISDYLISFRELRHISKVKVGMHEWGIIKLFLCERAKTDKELCVCVSRTVEWNPCQCLASLSSLLSWINGNVITYTHTHHPVHTHISFAMSFHTDMDIVTLHSPSPENTQHREGQRWLIHFAHTSVDLPRSVVYSK